MTRTFIEMLDDQDHHLGFFCTIGGLPYIFADFPEPSHWTLPAGYTWSQTFLPYRASRAGQFESVVKAVAERIDRETGITLSGNMDLEFLVDEDDPDDVWRNLVIPSSRATWYLDGEIVHKPSSTIWEFRSTTSIEGTTLLVDDEIYCGPGTAKVVSIDGTSVKVEINKYGSFHDWRGPVGLVRGAPRGGDVYITNWPKVWRRRPVSVWVVFRDKNGALSDDIYEEPCREIFPGECVTFPVWEAGSPTVGLICQGLENPLSNALVQRTRKYLPGAVDGRVGTCYLEATGPCLIEYDFHYLSYYVPWGWLDIDANLQGVIDLSATPAYIGGQDAWTLQDIITEALNDTFNDGSGDLNGLKFAFSEAARELDDDGDPFSGETYRAKLRMEVTRYYAGAYFGITAPIKFRVKTAQDPERSVFRALGFEEDIEWEGGDEYAEIWQGADASDPIPHYYLAPGNNWLHWHSDTVINLDCHDPPLTQGTVNLDGDIDGCFLRFGDHEVIEVAFGLPGSSVLLTDSNGNYTASILRRGVMGKAQPITVAVDDIEDEKNQLTLGLCFTRHDLYDVVLWLLVSNGDQNTGGLWDDPVAEYNVLPQGFGAAIPPSRIAGDSFEMLRFRSFRPKAYGLWIEGSLGAREFLSEVALFTGVNFLNVYDGTSKKLGGVPVEAPIGSEAVLDIDDTWADDFRKPVQPDYDEMTIRNRVSFEYDYDPLTKAFLGTDNRHIDGNSVASYGLSQPIEIRVRWLRSLPDVVAQIEGIAAALFRRFANPMIGYELEAATPEAWRLYPGVTVTVTREREPNFRDGGIGLDTVTMRVEHVEHNYGPEPTYGTVKVAWYVDRESLPWAPSMRLKALITGAQYEVYDVDSAEAFTPSEDSREDLEFFTVNDSVQIYFPGVDTTQQRTISAIDLVNNYVTFSSALTGFVDGMVVEFEQFNDSAMQEAQLYHVFMADSDGVNVDYNSNRVDGAKWS